MEFFGEYLCLSSDSKEKRRQLSGRKEEMMNLTFEELVSTKYQLYDPKREVRGLLSAVKLRDPMATFNAVITTNGSNMMDKCLMLPKHYFSFASFQAEQYKAEDTVHIFVLMGVGPRVIGGPTYSLQPGKLRDSGKKSNAEENSGNKSNAEEKSVHQVRCFLTRCPILCCTYRQNKSPCWNHTTEI